jgi:hypothetical protein
VTTDTNSCGTLHSTCCRRRAVSGVCQSDGHLQVGRLASRCDRRWHDVGGSLALEKTGAAGALTRAIVIHLQWAGTNVILCTLLALTAG